jgi:hypothetical protein
MRRPCLSFASSKSTLLLLLIAAGISFGVSSCSKDDNTNNSAVSQEQAASVVSQSVVSQGGIISQVNQATLAVNALEARKAQGGKLSDFCGKTEEANFKGADDGSASGIAFSYDLNWSYSLACLQEVPTEFTFTFNGNTSIATDKFATADSSSALYKLGGLGANSTTWTLNQTFDRMGKFTSKTTDVPSFNSTIHYMASDIKVNKQSLEIVSGTASVKITGTDLKGNAFSYEGTITFQGSKKAVLVIAGGKNFQLNW